MTIRMIDRALDAGINFIDTANVYNEGRSEEAIGKALRRRARPRRPRDQVPRHDGRGSERPWLSRRAPDRSSARLAPAPEHRLHRPLPDPPPWPDVPIDETLRALDDLVRAGKVRYIGSNFAAWQLVESLWAAEQMGQPRRHRAAAVQPARPPHRARAGAALPRPRARSPPVVAARERLPDREVPPGRARTRWVAVRGPEVGDVGDVPVHGGEPRRLRRGRLSGCSTSSRRSRPSTARLPARSASRGAPPSRAITSVILGPRTVEQLDDNLGRPRSPSATTTSPAWTRSHPPAGTSSPTGSPTSGRTGTAGSAPGWGCRERLVHGPHR